MSESTSNLPEKVTFGNADEECLRFYNGGDIAVISRDSDYFQLGKRIRDKFSDNNINVLTIVLDDNAVADAVLQSKLFSLPESVKLIIAVGGEQIINIARYFAGIFGTKVVAVPTVVTFMSIFAPKALIYENGVPKIFFCKEAEIIIDLVFLAGLKKQVFADAFCDVASKCVALADCRAKEIINGESGSGVLVAVYNILKSLSEMKESGAKCHVKIINAELRLGLLSKKNADFLFGSEVYSSIVLCNMRESSDYENRFFVNKQIIKLYEGFLLCDFVKALVSPNFVGNISELAKLIGASEMELIKKCKPQSLEQIIENRNKLISESALPFFKKLDALSDRLAEVYKLVYKGKQKRAEFEVKEIKRAIRLAPYLCDGGVLKIINESGACDCFE